MEPIMLTAMAIAYFITSSKTATAAYQNGKEPPSVAKARMLYEAGGGARTASGKPKGKGATRLLIATWWANACMEAQQRADNKAARRRAWYAETAPKMNEKWREKQLKRLEKSEAAAKKWAKRRGIVDLDEYRQRKAEKEVWEENARRDAADRAAQAAAEQAAAKQAAAKQAAIDQAQAALDNTAEVDAADAKGDETTAEPAAKDIEPAGNDTATERATDTGTTTDVPATPEPVQEPASVTPGGEAGQQLQAQPTETAPAAENPEAPAAPAATATPEIPAQTTTEGPSTVYEQAVHNLNGRADAVAEFHANLMAFADGMSHWGPEVSGVLQDMTTTSSELEGIYRDLATQMRHQGDNGADIYDQVPWVPDAATVLR